MTRGSQSLPRVHRVRRRAEFERAYAEGVRIQGRFMALFVVSTGAPLARLGVAASKKLGSAVERNRAKRLTRELFRRAKVAAGIDVIVVPRREMLDAPFTSLEADYQALLARRDQVRPGAGGRTPKRRDRSRPRTAARV